MVLCIIILVYTDEMVINPECFPKKSIGFISSHPRVVELATVSRMLKNIVEYLVVHMPTEILNFFGTVNEILFL